MAKAKDIKHLASDLKVVMENAKREAASQIHFSLQYRSPWWTGTFNRSWVISQTPVEPTKEREITGPWNKVKPVRKPPKFQKNIPPTSLSKSLYVGNEVEYAGFVVGQARWKGKSYYEHSQEKNITPRPKKYDWFQIYWKTGRMLKDVDNGFNKAGFNVVG